MRAALATLLILAAFPAAASAADVPPGATWTEATIPSADGVKLHADILRPTHLAATAKTPVILAIGPYFSHAGQTGAVGPVQGTSYDPLGPSTGPSDRFHDFINGARLMERGYTFVMVDLRGFGGSTGCLDWGGPGEQADVVAAVQWAAAQPWSTGAVGMYGKSYDGVTGLIGVNQRPAGLKAVVAQEPVYDLYRYLYGDGIRRINSVLTPALYDLIDATPGPLADSPDYNLAGADDTMRPGCKLANWADQAADDDHFSPYWRARTLIPGATGSDVPLFLTQGLTENNTVADGMAQYLRNHTGYDRFLKGETPAVEDPMVAVQTNDGVWRAEPQWPPADAADFTTPLRAGTYTDDGTASATGSSATNGVWTISKPLAHDVHLSGGGRAVVDVSTPLPRANLVVDVYDLDEDGRGPLITRQGHLIRAGGPVTLDLWSADWKLAAGHRIAVRVTDANTDWWVHAPTKQTVTVHGGSITLPLLTQPRTETIAGEPGVQLSAYLARRVTVPAATLEAAETEFDTP
jgi:predicted acyl esterase